MIAHDETGGLFLILALFAAVQESAFGTKRTFYALRQMSAFAGKADMAQCPLFTRKQNRHTP